MIIDFIGQCVINLFKSFKYVFTGRVNIRNTLIQASIIGYDSLPVALIITLVSGAVLALQVSKQFMMTGADSYVGGAVALVIIRETAPVFASLAIGARVGTSMAAEIGNMKITEQVDAMKTLKVDPIAYLLVPRLIAGIVMVPLVTIVAEFVGVWGGMVVSQQTIDLHPNRYFTSVWLYIKVFDVQVSLIKAMVFGMLITLIASTHGLLTKGGAKEVGIATTRAAIWASLAVLLFDYLLTWIYYG